MDEQSLTPCQTCGRPVLPGSSGILSFVGGVLGFIGGIFITAKMGWEPWGQWWIGALIGGAIGDALSPAPPEIPEPEGGWCTCSSAASDPHTYYLTGSDSGTAADGQDTHSDGGSADIDVDGGDFDF